MTRYLIDLHEPVHTCPADPVQSHPIDTRRTIVTVTPGGPCLKPVTIRCADRTVLVPCRHGRPVSRQCARCVPVIGIRHHTITDLGYQHPAPTPPPPSGYAADPCPVCRTPVAAFLRVHLLCGTARTARP